MKQVCVIDCGSGNLHSVMAGLKRAAKGKDVTLSLTQDPHALSQADGIILPGVGAFADCMAGLRALTGMKDALEQRVLSDNTPFLGICVGMQMLLERGLEHGSHQGLGWIKGEVVPIQPKDTSLKVPHMGWNELSIKKETHPLFEKISSEDHVYFVHSFHAECADSSNVLATVEYGETITAAIGRENIMGTQFHPEKSHKVGEKILANFLQLVDKGTHGD